MGEAQDLGVPAVLDGLGALVLRSAQFGAQQLLWSARESEWLALDGLSRIGYIRQEAADYGVIRRVVQSPSQRDLDIAHDLVNGFVAASWCEQCDDSSVQAHAICPDIFGAPELLCLYVPHPRAVESSGGNGLAKHWGTSAGCRAVSDRFDYVGSTRVAYHLYGVPLPTPVAINRLWCSHCAGAAHNLREHSRSKLLDSLGREPSESEVAAAVEAVLHDEARIDWDSAMLRRES